MVIRKHSVSNRWHQDYKNHNVYRSNPTSVSFDFPDHETCKKKTQQTPYFELKENNIKNLKKTNTNHKINTQLSDKNDSDKVCCSIKKIEAYKFKTKCNYATESFS